MKIRVFDNNGITMDRYIVLIGRHIFNMSYYADRANEVNTYAGTYKSDDEAMMAMMDLLKFTERDKIPKNLKYAIRQRCKQIRYDETNGD